MGELPTGKCDEAQVLRDTGSMGHGVDEALMGLMKHGIDETRD